jgi:predicted nucleotide-binding protein
MIRVLAVDDDLDFLQRLGAWLIGHGFDCSLFSRMEEARAALTREQFDIVLLDLMLSPKYDDEGLALLELVRTQQPQTRTVMMSTREAGVKQLVARAMKRGAQDFLDKNSEDFFFDLEATLQKELKERKRRIFVSHGHNDLLLLKLKNFLTSKLRQTVAVLAEQPNRGLTTVVEKLERISEECCFAVILMTKDDAQKDGAIRSRQNVIHEVGFFQGKYGRGNVVLLAERGVEIFSNVSGIVRIEFEPDHFDEVYEPLRLEIDACACLREEQ